MRKPQTTEQKTDIGPISGSGNSIPSKRERGRKVMLSAGLAAISLVLLAILCVYCLAPTWLPWSSSSERIDPSVMLGSYKPADALTYDAKLIEGSYEAEEPPWGDDEVFSLLIIGNDYDYSKDGRRTGGSAGRADTIMLLVIPKHNMSAGLISIPRDTMVNTAPGSTVKINSLYRAPEPTVLMTEVSRMTGVSVDKWVSVDFAGFIEIVDLLGGIDIDVQKRMKYTDYAGGYKIDLWPGLQHFDGEEALRYVRYRSDALGDIARVERQLGFVRALADKAVSWDTAGKLFALLYSTERNIKSDLSLAEAFALGVRLIRTGMGAIETWKAPGMFNGPYWQVDRTELMASIAKIIK